MGQSQKRFLAKRSSTTVVVSPHVSVSGYSYFGSSSYGGGTDRIKKKLIKALKIIFKFHYIKLKISLAVFQH